MRIGWTHLGVGPSAFLRVGEHAAASLKAAGHEVVRWAKGVQCDFVIAHHEHWWSLQEWGEYGVPWAPILLLDHDPISPLVEQALAHANAIICPTEYTLRVAQSLFPEKPCLLVYHSVDLEKFKPGPKPPWVPVGPVVIGCMKANSSLRPNFGALMHAFDLLRDEFAWTPDDARLYLHGDAKGRERREVQGINLNRAAQRFHLEPYMLLPWQRESLGNADCFRAMDVHVVPSIGEGFGLTAAESQACGVPTFVTDWAAGAEIVPPGMRLPIGARFMNPHAGDQAVVRGEDIAEVLHPFVADAVAGPGYASAKARRQEAGREAVKWVQKYDAGLVAQQWAEAAKTLEASRRKDHA